ncbi:unnamed protein product [Polarella glacialis]|uniref:TraB domain-containing protein n=1 Tax=Polarella glacialis TaxID=89957 RepID=A0A813FC34_POLGL|nr:unnamed protein product [Polarella glacialis]
MTLSGISVLYGIIECFAVEAGDEFLVAEAEASRRGIPCECIDVDLNRLCSRVAAALLPSPCNMLRSLLAWLALPRVLFQSLFPPSGNVDVLGATVLHCLSFRARTWIAFVLAGVCAGCFVGGFLLLFGNGAKDAAEASGAVSSDDGDQLLVYAMLAAELYVLPRIYDAVAASRDEAMYRCLVAKASRQSHRRLVVVVGAAHANGILQKVRDHGL